MKTRKRPAGGGKAKTQKVDLAARALRRLAWLMENAGSEQAQVAAAKELLDRMHGAAGAKPPLAADPGLEQVVARLRELRLAQDGKPPGGR